MWPRARFCSSLSLLGTGSPIPAWPCLVLTASLLSTHCPPGPAGQLLTLQEGTVAVADGRRDVHKELLAVPEHEQSQLPFRLLNQLPRVAQRQVLARYPIDLKGIKKEERTCINER